MGDSKCWLRPYACSPAGPHTDRPRLQVCQPSGWLHYTLQGPCTHHVVPKAAVCRTRRSMPDLLDTSSTDTCRARSSWHRESHTDSSCLPAHHGQQTQTRKRSARARQRSRVRIRITGSTAALTLGLLRCQRKGCEGCKTRWERRSLCFLGRALATKQDRMLVA